MELQALTGLGGSARKTSQAGAVVGHVLLFRLDQHRRLEVRP